MKDNISGRLRGSERVEYALRGLFEQRGYIKYRMGKFEEYDFYTEHKEFLPSGHILTFTDLDGKLKALKPDVTMSIVKRTRATKEAPERLYYNESIYRPTRDTREFCEIHQIGLEYIGSVSAKTNEEVVGLALNSLSGIIPDTDDGYILDVSHNGFYSGLFDGLNVHDSLKLELSRCIASKNMHGLDELLAKHKISKVISERLQRFASLCDTLKNADARKIIEDAREISVNEKTDAALNELSDLFLKFHKESVSGALRLDFSLTHDGAYYNGLLFRGYIKNTPRHMLSGGRYDNLLSRMGVEGLEAIGFAVYLNEIEVLND